MARLLQSLAAALIVALALPAHAETLEKDLVITAKIPRTGDFLAYGFDAVWMMSGAKLVRVNPADNSVTETFIKDSLGKFRAYQIGEGAIWLPDVAADRIFKVDPASAKVTMSMAVPMDRPAGSIGVGLGSVWVVADGTDRRLLMRLSTATGADEARIKLPGDGAGVFVAFGSVWVTAPRSDELYRIDPASNSVAQTITLASQPRFLTADENAVWVADQGGFLQRVNGRSGTVESTIETGLVGAGGDIDAGGGYIWITSRSLALMQVDPKTNRIIAKYHAPDVGHAVRYGAGSVWISGPALHRIALP